MFKVAMNHKTKIRQRSYIKAGLLLCVMLSFIQTRAQKTFKELSVGDKLPDIEIRHIINYSKSAARVSDFMGKPLILDFWAPWCSPCVAAFAKLDSFQKKFEGKLRILPVTTESKEFSARLIAGLKKARNINLTTSVVEDTTLSRLFFHRLLPHYVWIEGNGIVKAITGPEEVSEENIALFIEGKPLSVRVKHDGLEPFVRDKPSFGGDQVAFNNELIFHSVLTRFIQGYPTASSQRKNWIRCTSHSISLLYKIAFGEFGLQFMSDNRVILEGFNSTMDSLEIGMYTDRTFNQWQDMIHDHLYNYELVVPDSSFNKTEQYAIMQQDLNRIFGLRGIQARKEKKTVKVLALVRTSAEDKLKTANAATVDEHSDFYLKISNRPLYVFVEKLQAFFSKDGSLPVTNETGYKGRIDIELNCDMTDMNAVNKELGKYDLQLKEKQEEIEMLIITKTARKQGYATN